MAEVGHNQSVATSGYGTPSLLESIGRETYLMSFFVGAYWGVREERREACAERIAAFLLSVSTLDVALAQWSKQTASRRKAQTAISADQQSIQSLLSTNKTDIGKTTIPELGFSFSAENRDKVWLQATVGAFHPRISNAVVVTFSMEKTPPRLELLQGLVHSAVNAFDPDHAAAFSRDVFRGVQGQPLLQRPAVYRYVKSVGFSAA